MISKTIALPEPMAAWVDAQVVQGGYADESDYVRALILRDQEDRAKLAELRTAIAKGRASGISMVTVGDIIAEAQAEIDAGL